MKLNRLSEVVNMIEPSSTLRIDSKAKEMKKAGEDVVLFTAGEPDFPTPDEIKDAAKAAIDANFTKYTKSTGIVELRERICKKLKDENGLEYSPDEIVVSNGGKQALFNIFGSIINPDDEIIVLTPAWVSYAPQVRLWKGKEVFVHTFPEDGYLPKVEDLEKALTPRTKAILINSPNNPTGVVYGEETISMIAGFAKEHDLYVVADEVYEKLAYDLPHISIASLDGMKERTLMINGFSKSHSMTGWRVGYSVAPLGISKEIAKIQSHMTSNINSIAQKAALMALDVDTSAMVREFRARRDLVVNSLGDAGFKFFKPSGAFYVMIDVREFLHRRTTEELCMDLMENAGVAMIPGDGFKCPGYLRVSFATSQEEIKKGIQRFSTYLNGC